MRKARYLVAGAASLAKPLFLGTIAVGIGLGDSGGFASAYLRCLIFPSVVPAVCMFFLYVDETRYGAYKPLAGFMAIGSATLLAAAIFPGLRDAQKLLIAAKDVHVLARSVAAFLAALLADLFCVFALLPDAWKGAGKAPPASLSGGAPSSNGETNHEAGGDATRDVTSRQIPLPNKEQ